MNSYAKFGGDARRRYYAICEKPMGGTYVPPSRARIGIITYFPLKAKLMFHTLINTDFCQLGCRPGCDYSAPGGYQRYLQFGFHSLWYGNMVACPHVLQHLAVTEPLKREAAEGADLEEQHTVRPDVRLGREDTIGQGLWRHPADGQHTWIAHRRRQSSAELCTKSAALAFGGHFSS